MVSNGNLRRLLVVIMDGVGERENSFGNACHLAYTPNLDFLRKQGIFTTLNAHGPFVGLPSEIDIGNSEVGHNALGAGRIFDQGAKLVEIGLNDGTVFRGPVWQKLIKQVTGRKTTMHFIGLLSDGNVHSHQNHLHKMMREAQKQGVERIRVHVLLDGRDVPDRSASKFVSNLEKEISELKSAGCDAAIASGGGRMFMTMDRYGADWEMVARGWQAHVLGRATHKVSSVHEFLELPAVAETMDQYLPGFVVVKDGRPIGPITDGDSVVLFNFRGDRAIEISRAFEEKNFSEFDRENVPSVEFAGMMQYDGDLQVPKQFLVSPPLITESLGEYMVSQGLRQFACSETQKFGHVTYFWNGNRTNPFDSRLECYSEIPSDAVQFHLKPWMKAHEIVSETVAHLTSDSFDFARINLPNGDMVGHTGDFQAAVTAMATVDLAIGRLLSACIATGTILLVTADHGNCDEMFLADDRDFPNWREASWLGAKPAPKTSHTLSQVPFYLYDPQNPGGWRLRDLAESERTLANVANTCLGVMGCSPRSIYHPSLVE